VYQPLKDINNNVIGMLFIGQPQSSVLQSASRSIQLTFIVAVALLALAIVPAYWMSRYIARQLE
jgi:ABC-type spermidine/putrescine transport system permease subunit I